jgi:hypothetical protein
MLATGERVGEHDGAARDWYERASQSGGPARVGRRSLRGYVYLPVAADAGYARAARMIATTDPQVCDAARAQAAEIATLWQADHTAPLP